jgi:hypothetical protein
LSVSELLAQLGGTATETREAYNGIQAIWNWQNADKAWILDWPKIFIRENVFGIPTPKDEPLPHITKTLSQCLQNGLDLTSLRIAAVPVRKSWEKIELKSAQARRSIALNLRHRKIKAPRDELLNASVQVLSALAGTPAPTVKRDEILGKLSAYHESFIKTLSVSLRCHIFNFLSKKRLNDELDTEQLIYLADDRARYLTADGRAYKCLKGTPQAHRIWIENPSTLNNAEGALTILRQMLES